jgi:hypothetical protein
VISCNHAWQYGGWQQQASMLTAGHRVVSGTPATGAALPTSQTGAGPGMDTSGRQLLSCSDDQPMTLESGQVQHQAMPQLVDNAPYSCLSQAPSRVLCPSPPALISTAALLPCSPAAQPMGIANCSQQWRNGADDAGTTAAAYLAQLAAAPAVSTGCHAQQPAAAAVPDACSADADGAGDRQPGATVPEPVHRHGGLPSMPALPLRPAVPTSGTSCNTSRGSSGTPTAAGPLGSTLPANEPGTPATPSGERSV